MVERDGEPEGWLVQPELFSAGFRVGARRRRPADPAPGRIRAITGSSHGA